MPTWINGYSAGEIPKAIILKGVSVRFDCQHDLRLNAKVKLVRYYNAFGLIVAHPERFELPTKWFEATYSIQLSYGCEILNSN